MFTTFKHSSPGMLALAPFRGATAARLSTAPLKITTAPNTTATAVSAAATEASSAQPNVKPAFENTQRFVVPDDVKGQFEAAWKAREAYMETQAGFIGFNMTASEDTYTITSKWASIPEWEAFNLSKEARRHHLPFGIFQHVPKAGEGFPEDFVPFLEMHAFVQAKYPKKK